MWHGSNSFITAEKRESEDVQSIPDVVIAPRAQALRQAPWQRAHPPPHALRAPLLLLVLRVLWLAPPDWTGQMGVNDLSDYSMWCSHGIYRSIFSPWVGPKH